MTTRPAKTDKPAKTPLPAEILALTPWEGVIVTGEVKGSRVLIRLRDPKYIEDPIASCTRQKIAMGRIAWVLRDTHAAKRDGFRGRTARNLYCFFDAK